MSRLIAAKLSNAFLTFYVIALFIERLPLCSGFAVPSRCASHQLHQQQRTASLSIFTATVSSSDLVLDRDEHFMRLALRHAQHSFREKEVPVGAVIVDANGIVLAASRNEVEAKNDVTAHAEISCIRKVAQMKNNWRLSDCTLYSTLEPCPMCMGAVQASRIKRVVYGAPDLRMGACGSWVNLVDMKHPFHTVEVVGGLLSLESSTLLKRFFQMRRREAASINAADKMIAASNLANNAEIIVANSKSIDEHTGTSKAIHVDRGYDMELALDISNDII